MAERIIDACCLINIYATSEEAGIVQACGGFFVSDQVRAETLGIRRVDDEDPSRLVSREIDLGDAIAAGHLKTCQLDGQDELGAYVRFAMELDDGEASCLAIAKSRCWTVATDDRKAKRIASENGIDLIGTPELIQKWADETSTDETSAGEVLRRIERFARYRPRRSDPLYGWWTGIVRR